MQRKWTTEVVTTSHVAKNAKGNFIFAFLASFARDNFCVNTKSDGFKVLLGVVGGMAAIIVFGLLLSFAPELVQSARPTPTPGGIVAGQYRQVPDVQLVNQDNQPLTLTDLRGKAVVLAFGYTHCPDVCPLFMSDMRKIKQQLGSDASQTTFVFISVDPKRDTPAVLKKYVTAFDPSFLGATADDATLKKTIYAFDGMFEIGKPDDKNPNSYSVAHTSFLYLIDPQGKWQMKYPFGTDVAVIAKDVQGILKSSAN